jgi:hypothetical protein
MIKRLFNSILKRNTRLENKLNQINTIDNINNGGCGFTALSIYDRMIKDGYKPKIIYLYKEDRYNRAYRYIQEGHGNSTSHVVIELNNFYYDSNGINTKEVINDAYEVYHSHEVTRDYLIKSLKEGNRNELFKKENVNKIDKILNTNTRNYV